MSKYTDAISVSVWDALRLVKDYTVKWDRNDSEKTEYVDHLNEEVTET